VLHVGEAEVCLVDERRCLQAVPGPLSGHALARDALKLTVNERHECPQRRVITSSPCEQQLSDFLCVVCNGAILRLPSMLFHTFDRPRPYIGRSSLQRQRRERATRTVIAA